MNFVPSESGLLVPEEPKVLFSGRYDGRIIRAGEVIDEFSFDNTIVNQGLNYLLNVALASATQLSAWYVGLFQGNYTPVAGDTASSIASNSTECSSYTASTRQAFTGVTSTAESITNAASQATFTFSAAVTIYGAFVISSSAINGTTGTLLSAARLASSKSVSSGDQLLISYTLNAASS